MFSLYSAEDRTREGKIHPVHVYIYLEVCIAETGNKGQMESVSVAINTKWLRCLLIAG